MRKVIIVACLLGLAVPSVMRAQSDTTRAPGSAAAAAVKKPKVSGPALASEPRDSSDHADNRGEEYFRGIFDGDPRTDSGEQGADRDDTENKRESDVQTGQSDQGGSDQ